MFFFFQRKPQTIAGAVRESHRSGEDRAGDDAPVLAEGRGGGAAQGVGALGARLDRQLGTPPFPHRTLNIQGICQVRLALQHCFLLNLHLKSFL